MEDALLPPKRQVAGSNPAEPTTFAPYFQSLGVRPVLVRLTIESNRGRIEMSFDNRLTS